ncbi:MAG TPA: hypothetical protein VLC09_13995 [Polyangiaceae bacterium]|nr:hypothetical protein [Polyangiaceae bacterium]
MSEPHVVLVRSGPERPWVGQAVRFDVQLRRAWSDQGPAPAFDFDEVRVTGAIARFREEAPPPDEVQEDGEHVLVQHRTLLVIPQSAGTVTVPPLRARWNEGRAVHTAVSAALDFPAALPPGASEELVVAPRVTLRQELSSDLSGLRVADGFTRTLELDAEGTDPIALPTLRFAAIDGLSLHPASPRDGSSAERGELQASRTFVATYVVERVGHYELPALEVRWLEPATGRYHTAHAPAVDFWAWPNTSLGWGMWGSVGAIQLAGFGLVVALLAGIVTFAWQRARNGPFGFERRWRELRAEQRAFARVLRSLSAGSPVAQLRELYGWLLARFPLRSERTLEPVRRADESAAKALALIEGSAFGPSAASPEPKSWTKALKRARRALAKRNEAGVSVPWAINGRGRRR